MNLLTTDQYATLKSLADDVASARGFDKSFERFVKIVVEDNGEERIVRKFSQEGTRAALLVAMASAAMFGNDPMNAVAAKATETKKPQGKAAAPKDEVDEFTQRDLDKVAPGGPEQSILKPPHAKMEERVILPLVVGKSVGKSHGCLDCGGHGPWGRDTYFCEMCSGGGPKNAPMANKFWSMNEEDRKKFVKNRRKQQRRKEKRNAPAA